jgi:hypothetical protein
VGRAEWGKEAKKSLFRERVDAWEGDLGGAGGGLGVVENGEEKKAWVLLTGGGVLRASGDTSEKEEDREEEALRGDEVDEDVERDSSGRVVAGDHCSGWASMVLCTRHARGVSVIKG